MTVYVKVSELPPAAALTGAEVFPLIQSGATVGATAQDVANLAGGGATDGDKGDITVSGSGATWTIDDGAVNTAKLGGDITAAGKALLDDANAAAQRTTLGLGNVNNTSDANKPVSNATQTALNGKEPTISAGTTGQYWRGDKSWQALDKSAVGLANVDNTSDANKPVSNATQTALNGKLDTSSVGSTVQGYDPDLAALAALTGTGLLRRTGSGTASAGDKVSYSEIQDVSATARLLGRKTSGAGPLEELTASDVLAMLGVTAGKEVGSIAKSSDETRASTTTVTADSALSFPMTASKTYRVRLQIVIETASSAPGFKFSLLTSGAITAIRGSYTGARFLSTTLIGHFTSAPTDVDAGYGNGSLYVLSVDAYIVNSGSSNTFSFGWAQQTSSGSNVTVHAGSILDYQEV